MIETVKWAVLFALCPWGVQADALFPQGKCAIVLSSRPSLQSAQEDIRTRWAGRDVQIYLSSNGWYAITVGLIDTASSKSILFSLKQQNLIPHDAFCSSGKSYIRRIAEGFPTVTPPETTTSTRQTSTLCLWKIKDFCNSRSPLMVNIMGCLMEAGEN